ncbi:Spermatogenesis-associated protein 17 [Paragonimus heterotremus]|uniref:Spermatogenesis-associated protein 17 n=1 Tax=Paragonimus heterotremus TaxID=100268 RepID=A0A8J4T1A1_9TREM|nr:Spermatogenesis-associated protein 17 [Paragonimus heterotremus]
MTNHAILLQFTDEFNRELCASYRNSNELRVFEYNAAVRIQAWFRGIRIRCYLKFLNGCCVTIQKLWRGFLGRRVYRRMLSEAVLRMRCNHYAQCAAKIQSAWRGYRSRKYRFNFYARKVYLETLKEVGKYIRTRLAEYEHDQDDHQQVTVETNEQDRLWEWAKLHHYFISTFAQPGVYNAPNKSGPKTIEQLLQSVRSDLAKESMPGYKHRRADAQKSTEEATSVKLPPIVGLRPKGPFRAAEEVRQWRNTPLSLSLRVTTDYFSLEKAREQMKFDEWAGRVHDKPFHAGTVPSPKYQRMHMTTSKYGPISYGTKHFRFYEDTDELQGIKNIQEESQVVRTKSAKPRFRTVLPPIAVFDRFNKEYIPGYAEG